MEGGTGGLTTGGVTTGVVDPLLPWFVFLTGFVASGLIPMSLNAKGTFGSN